MQSSPGFVEAMKGAAASTGAMGRTAQSRSMWEEVAELAPQDVEVQQALALFRAADNAAAEAEAAAEAAAAAQAQAEQEAAEAAALAAAQAQQVQNAANVVPPPQQPVAPPVADQPETPPAQEQPVAQPPVTEPTEPEPPVADPPDEEQEPAVAEPPVPASGPTLALLDTTLTPAAPEAGGEGAFTFMPAPAAAVGNLDSPYDYGQGTLYLQVEVLDRPTDDPVFMQLCLVPDDLITVSP